jgi:hypothetical protein
VRKLLILLLLCTANYDPLFAEDAPRPRPQSSSLPQAPSTPVTVQSKAETVETFPSLGPTLSIEVPHPIFLDLEKRWNKSFSSAIGLGGFKLTVTTNSIPVSLGIGGADARFRWHPFEGAFFIGVMVGYQKIWGSAQDSIPVSGSVPGLGTVSTTANIIASVNVSGIYAAPHVGWLWVWDNGFTLGAELGWQFAFASTTDIESSGATAQDQLLVDLAKLTTQYQNLQNQVQNAGNQVGNTGFPYFCLIRVGYLF